jgi:hypothetical protein
MRVRATDGFTVAEFFKVESEAEREAPKVSF